MYKTVLVLLCSCLSFAIKSQATWQLKKEKDGIKAYVRDVEHYSINELRIESEIEGTINEAVAMMKDELTYKNITPHVAYVEHFKNEDDLMEVYMATRVPFPAKDRDGYYVNRFNYNKSKAMVTIDLSCPEDRIKKNSAYIRISDCKGFWQFQQISENKMLLNYQFVANPGGWVPEFIANLFLISNPIKTVANMKQAIKNPKFKGQSFDFMKK